MEIRDTSGGSCIDRREFLLAASVLAAAPAALRGAEGGKVKAGVIGCGSVSGSYLPVMAASPHIELVSACDIIPSRAEERARQFKIPHTFPDIDRMLAGPPFDLLVDLTSMPSHYTVNRKGLSPATTTAPPTATRGGPTSTRSTSWAPRGTCTSAATTGDPTAST